MASDMPENAPTGVDLLRDPYLNKGTAFSTAERTRFGLHGYLPPKVETIEEQAERAYEIVASKPTSLEKYNALADIQDTNETLFFKVIGDHIKEFAPIIYTPTIGEVCQKFSQVYRRPRGMWLTEENAGNLSTIFQNDKRDIKLIVVTDNERILGLGDLGAGGLGIPIGKLNLYIAGAGIKPAEVLPISLDVGTNSDRQYIRDGEHYLGVQKTRWRNRGSGEVEQKKNEMAYNDFLDEFMEAVTKRWPKVLIQFEDFWKTNAQNVLDKYRDRYLSFNDDIQGTAAVGVAGVFAAYRWLHKHDSSISLKDARLCMLGGGAAGIGITNLFEMGLRREGCEDPKSQIVVLDSVGLISHSREYERNGQKKQGYGGDRFKDQYAWPEERVQEYFPGQGKGCIGLAEVVKQFKPTILIGTSGTPGMFTQEVIENMTQACSTGHPIIMPMSNPTSKCEAQPVDIMKWSDEKAIVATGSPFAPVLLKDGTKKRIGQGNNVFIFPGLGLGALLAKCEKVTDNMIMRSAMAVAGQVTVADLQEGSCYPSISRLVDVSAHVAVDVIKQAIDDGTSGIQVGVDVASLDPATIDEELMKYVLNNSWTPAYKNYA